MCYFGLCDGMRKLNIPDIEYLDMYEGEFSKFYDSLVSNDNYDFDFLDQILNNTKKPILELACGSGRVMIPLLEKGYNVSGVDLSDDMLTILKRKCKKRNFEIDLFKDDMCSFKTNSKYEYVILSHISICLLEPKEQRKLFVNLSKNILEDGGKFIFNFTEYSGKLYTSGELKPRYYFNTKNKSFAIFFEKVDLKDNKVYINMYMEQNVNDKTKKYIGTSCKNIIKRKEIEKYINEAGLLIIDEKKFFISDSAITYLILEKPPN